MKKRTFLAGAMALALAGGAVLAPSVADAATIHGGGGDNGAGGGFHRGGFHGGGVAIKSGRLPRRRSPPRRRLSRLAAMVTAGAVTAAGGMASTTRALGVPCSWSWGCAVLRPFECGLHMPAGCPHPKELGSPRRKFRFRPKLDPQLDRAVFDWPPRGMADVQCDA